MILREMSMQIKHLSEEGVPKSRIARQLGVSRSTVNGGRMLRPVVCAPYEPDQISFRNSMLQPVCQEWKIAWGVGFLRIPLPFSLRTLPMSPPVVSWTKATV